MLKVERYPVLVDNGYYRGDPSDKSIITLFYLTSLDNQRHGFALSRTAPW